MFFHNLKYEIITTFRVRDFIFWLMVFPIILGGLFKVAFGNIYDKDVVFNTIPTGVVEHEKNDTFKDVIKSVEEGDNPLIKVTYYKDEKEAKASLKAGDIKGIIYVDKEKSEKDDDSLLAKGAEMLGYSIEPTKLTLTVASNDTESTILKKFIENYMARERAVYDAAKKDPGAINDVVSALSDELNVTSEMPLTDGKTDPFLQYFYNLIAMVALFGSITGLHIAIGNQGNLSDLGARRCCSPTPKSIAMIAGLIGSFIAQALCVAITITFEVLVLGVDYGSRLPFVYISGILGGVVGVSLGFFVGSIGNLSTNLKVGISMGVTMPLCFLSGLMMGDMKSILEMNAPIVNDLNPAAVVTDSIYYLTVDPDLSRYWVKIISMFGFTAVFVALGVILTRRKQYASL